MNFTSLPKDTRNGLLSVLAFVAVIISIIVPLTVTVQREATGNSQYMNVDISGANYSCAEGCFIYGFTPDATEDGLVVVGKIISVDPVLGTVRFRFDWYPSGSFLKEGSTNRLARNITLTVGNQPAVTVRDGSVIPFSEISTLLWDGDVLQYPFDSYNADILLSATTPNYFDGSQEIVPIGAMLAGGLATYSLSAKHSIYSIQGIIEDAVDSLEYAVFFARSTTTKFFAIVLGVVMWLLALSQVAIVLDKLFFRPERKIELGQLGVATGILFALPGIRGAQPSAPPAGTVLDTATFFWCEVLVALCVVVQLWSWMLAWKAPAPAKDEKKDVTEVKTVEVIAKNEAVDVPVSSWIAVDAGSNAVVASRG